LITDEINQQVAIDIAMGRQEMVGFVASRITHHASRITR